MIYLKKIFFIFAAIFLIWQSIGLVAALDNMASINPLPSLGVAWILNMFITGIFAFGVFALPLYRLLPKSYYTIENKKKFLQFYQIAQVDIFRKMLLATVWRSKEQQKKYFDGTPEGIQELKVNSMQSEFGHLIPFIVLSFVGMYFLSQSGLRYLGFFVLLWNVLGNFYPIPLQRHHRLRIQRIEKIQQRRR